jgi:hypothetical protein
MEITPTQFRECMEGAIALRYINGRVSVIALSLQEGNNWFAPTCLPYRENIDLLNRPIYHNDNWL